MGVTEATKYENVLDVARRAARAAAQVHESHLGRVKGDAWSSKGISDFVTFVDEEAEAEILAQIRGAFPSHNILAEESHPAVSAEEAEGAEWVWIVDPLDGTTNFLHQYPMYCASIGVLHRGAPAVAAVASSASHQEWTAVRGGGAYLNGQRIYVSEIEQMNRALIGTGFPFKLPHILPKYLRQFDHIIRHASDIRRGGSAALDLCHLASGYLDGFWELDLRPWDYAAGVLMIREAGGVVSGLTGEPEWSAAGGGIIAGNPFVYNEITRMLIEVAA